MITELRLALRRILRQPALSFCVVTLVTLGITTSAAVFSILDGVLLKPLPFLNADELVALGRVARLGDQFGLISPRSYWAIRDSHALAGVAAISPWWSSDSPDDAGIVGADVTPDLFQVVAERPIVGRTLSEGDATAAEPRPVVIGYELWEKRFGGSSATLGSVVTIARKRVAIVGIMRRGFDFPRGTNVWAAADLLPEPDYAAYNYLQCVGRLRPRVGVTSSERLASMAAGEAVKTMPLRDWIRPRSPRVLVLLSAGALLVLLLTWVEVAFLQMTRAVSTSREIGVRLALGASRIRVLSQSTLEGAILGAVALAGAWLGTTALTTLIVSFLPPELVLGQRVVADFRVLFFASLTACAGILAFTSAPAQLVSTTRLDDALRGGFRTGSTRGSVRVRTALLVAQIAISSGLVYLGGLTLQSFVKVNQVNLGFQPQGLIAVSLPRAEDAADDVTWQWFDETAAAVRELPGVTHVSGTLFRPFSRGVVLSRASHPNSPADGAVGVGHEYVAPGYFSVMGGQVLSGREFSTDDKKGNPLVAILNEAAAGAIGYASSDAGRQIIVDGFPHEVVGVVRNMRTVRPDETPRPLVYSSSAQWRPPAWLLVRIGENRNAASMLRSAVTRIWGRSPTVIDVAGESHRVAAPFRLRLQLLLTLSLTGLALAAVGLYGGITFAVSQRTREYAIRMALGAAPATVQFSIIGTALRIACLGAAIGMAMGFGVAVAASELLFGVAAADGPTSAGVAVVACAVSLSATVVPARRAATIQPGEALHQE